MKIPRVIHRIWLGESPLPEEFRKFGETWQRHHPGWQLKLWTDRNLPPLANRWAFSRSRSFSGKANVLRYELLLRFGGLYVDTDFECRRSLEPIVDGLDCFAGEYDTEVFEHGSFTMVNNALIGAVPGHPFLRDLVAEAQANMRTMVGRTDLPVYQTGTVFFTSVLQRHPEVHTFPPRYFYPYGPQERWRRHERFPRAYAVHHWTLNGLTALRRTARRLGRGARPSLTVALKFTRPADPVRLRWVLEGLCAQTVSDFEVLAPRPIGGWCRALLQEFRGRLKIRVASQAHAPRILFLEGDHVPDPDVVEMHAALGTRPIALCGFSRAYPAAKVFPFRDAMDYAGLLAHSRPGQPPVHFAPRTQASIGISSSCFSAPREALTGVGGIWDRTGGQLAALGREGCPASPCLTGATVTWLRRTLSVQPIRRKSSP